MVRLEVKNPVAEQSISKVKLAPRLSDLKGKTIGLYWNMKAGGDVVLDRTLELLSEKYEDLHFKRFNGSVGFSMRHVTPDDADQIATECDAVIGATSD